MTWKYFLEHYDDLNWDEDRVLRAVRELKSFGTSAELAENLPYLDERAAKLLLRRALEAGMTFQPEDIMKMDGLDLEDITLVIEDSLNKGITFTLDELLEILPMAEDRMCCRLIDGYLSGTKDLSFDAFEELEDAVAGEPVNHLMRRYLERGFAFTKEQILKLQYDVDNALLQKAVLQSGLVFSEQEIQTLACCLDNQAVAALQKRLKKKEGFFSRHRHDSRSERSADPGLAMGFFAVPESRPVKKPRFKKGDRVSFYGDIFDTIDAEGLYIEGVVLEVRDGKCRIELADTFMTPWIPEEHLRKLEFW